MQTCMKKHIIWYLLPSLPVSISFPGLLLFQYKPEISYCIHWPLVRQGYYWSYSFSLSCPFHQLVSCCTTPQTLLHYNVFCDFSKILIVILLLYLKTHLHLFHFSPKKAKVKGNFVLSRSSSRSGNQGLWVKSSPYPVFCTVRELGILFIFLNGWGGNERK